jgi:hypothetical protein
MGVERQWALGGRRGTWEYKPKQAPDVDVAVIGLDNACADDLEEYYQFTARTPLTHFFIAGYPASRNRFRSVGHGLPSRATFVVAREFIKLGNL